MCSFIAQPSDPNPTSANRQDFCQISELLFQFLVWVVLCSSGAFTYKGICRTVCSISPFKSSCARCRLACRCQGSGMETTGRMGHCTELQQRAGLHTYAKGFLESATNDSSHLTLERLNDLLKAQKQTWEEPCWIRILDRIFSCCPQHH